MIFAFFWTLRWGFTDRKPFLNQDFGSKLTLRYDILAQDGLDQMVDGGSRNYLQQQQPNRLIQRSNNLIAYFALGCYTSANNALVCEEIELMKNFKHHFRLSKPKMNYFGQELSLEMAA